MFLLAQQLKSGDAAYGMGGAICLGSIALLLYLLPTIVAVCRAHQNLLAISVLNILTGWSFVGWVVAMVWACTEVRGGRSYRGGSSSGLYRSDFD